jgi:tetrahydromethanopterin S-methyltransferase subunit F
MDAQRTWLFFLSWRQIVCFVFVSLILYKTKTKTKPKKKRQPKFQFSTINEKKNKKKSLITMFHGRTNGPGNILSNSELFLNSEIIEQGGHMVMTNVVRPRKYQYLNLDTRFSTSSSSSSSSSPWQYQFLLADRVTNVKSIEILSVQYLETYLMNISAMRGNNEFHISTGPDFEMFISVHLPSRKYTSVDDLVESINNEIQLIARDLRVSNAAAAAAAGGGGEGGVVVSDDDEMLTAQQAATEYQHVDELRFHTVDGRIRIVSSSASSSWFISWIHPRDGLNRQSHNDAFVFRKSLGWLLGFREIHSKLLANDQGSKMMIDATALPDISGPKYAYVILDGFVNTSSNAWIAQYSGLALSSRNIFARIAFGTGAASHHPHLQTATQKHGNLDAPLVEYSAAAGVALHRMTLQLVDEFGNPLDLGGTDYNLVCRIERE